MIQLKVYPKLLLVFFGLFFFLLLSGGFSSFSLAACPEGQECPDGDWCVSACDAWYDDQYCFCFCPMSEVTSTTCGCGVCGGGCFLKETEVATEQESDQATENISNLKSGDTVSSFKPETGEIKEGTVSDVYKLAREGYYELETATGKKVKVTGEHPFLAIKSEGNLLTKLEGIFSQTLTYRLIIGLRGKLENLDLK